MGGKSSEGIPENVYIETSYFKYAPNSLNSLIKDEANRYDTSEDNVFLTIQPGKKITEEEVLNVINGEEVSFKIHGEPTMREEYNEFVKSVKDQTQNYVFLVVSYEGETLS